MNWMMGIWNLLHLKYSVLHTVSEKAQMFKNTGQSIVNLNILEIKYSNELPTMT